MVKIILDGQIRVRDDGTIWKRLHNGRWKEITPNRTTNKYSFVRVYEGKNKYKTYPAHRLVAMAFIPNPQNKPEINHINGIKFDNRIENLEWVTRAENSQHAVRTGLAKRMGRKMSRCSEYKYPIVAEEISKQGYKLSDVAFAIHKSQPTVSRILRGYTRLDVETAYKIAEFLGKDEKWMTDSFSSNSAINTTNTLDISEPDSNNVNLLLSFDSFEDLYIAVNERILDCTLNELCELLKTLNDFRFTKKHGKAIVFLRDALSREILLISK